MPPRKWKRPRAAVVFLTAAVLALVVGALNLLRRPRPPAGATPEAAVAEASPQAGPRGAAFSLIVTDVLATVSGTAPVAGSVEVVLLAPDGAERARVSASPGAAGARWRTRFAADDGGDLYPRPGDRISVQSGATSALVTIPPLDLRVNRAAGIMAGRTAPGSQVILEAKGASVPVVEYVGSAGAFSAAVPGGTGLAGRRPITITVQTPDGSRFVHQRTVPYVRASLHPGDVNGVMRPLARVDVSLFGPGGRRRGRGQAVTDSAGRYNTWLRDDTGTLVRGVPGDRLVAQDGETYLTLTLPDLTTGYEFQTSRVIGTGTPGATVGLYLWHPWREGDLAEPSATVPEDGHWSLPAQYGIFPATHYYVTLHLETGDEVTHCQQVPRLHIQPGSPVVAIDALWDMVADLSLVRRGKRVASAGGGGAWTRDLTLVFKDSNGRPVAVLAGDEVQGSLNEMSVDIAVTKLEARVGDDGRITGTAPGGVEVGLADQTTLGETVTVGPDGHFSLDPLGRVAAGAVAAHRRFAVYYETPGGHVIRHLFRGPSMSPELGTRIVGGTAAPGSKVVLERRGQEGGSGGGTTTTADVTGIFTATFAASEPALAAGETLILASGPVTTSLTLPQLAADLDPVAGELAGNAPAWSVLGAFFYLGSSPEPEERHVVVGEDGAWTLPLTSPVNGLGAIDPARVRAVEITWTAEGEEETEIEDVVRLSVPGPLGASAGQGGS